MKKLFALLLLSVFLISFASAIDPSNNTIKENNIPIKYIIITILTFLILCLVALLVLDNFLGKQKCNKCGSNKIMSYENSVNEYICEGCGNQWQITKDGEVFEL